MWPQVMAVVVSGENGPSGELWRSLSFALPPPATAKGGAAQALRAAAADCQDLTMKCPVWVGALAPAEAAMAEVRWACAGGRCMFSLMLTT